MSISRKKGFTLVELLMVIGIVSLLSSIVFASVNVARAKGRDARRQEDMASVKTAVMSYINDHGDAPPNYNGNYLAIEDTAHPNDAFTNASGQAYNQFMNDLVAGKYLSAPVYSPSGAVAPYTYFNYGSQSAGAIFATKFESIAPTQTGLPNTCRPFAVVGSDICIYATNGNSDYTNSLAAVNQAQQYQSGNYSYRERSLTQYEVAQGIKKCFQQDAQQPVDNENDTQYDNLCMRNSSQAVCYCMR